MGIPVFILGESGTGKSCSIRTFKENIGILNVASKPLPFKNNLMVVNLKPKNAKMVDGSIGIMSNYEQIKKTLKKDTLRTYVIDDSQYLMSFELFDKVNNKGYDKFTHIAVNFKNLIDVVVNNTSDDTIVYFLHHTESNEFGKTKAKTIGKMLDNTITLEGLFSIVLNSKVENGKYSFITQNDGNNTCKSPMEMFPLEIDNDLKYVDDTIRAYYNLGGLNNDTDK